MLGQSDDVINFTANEHRGTEQFSITTNESVGCCLHIVNRGQVHILPSEADTCVQK